VSTPLVYIGGSGRSGSTLLERMLSCVPGFWPVGELVFIWERGLRRNDLCSCGARFTECEFWDRVGQAGFGGWDQVDVDRAVALRRAVDRHRNFGRLAGLRPPGQLGATLDAYADLTARLYAAVRTVSGASVIVDSSKHVGYALLLRRLPDFDVRLVHLIRRSHGVVHSWSKRVRKPGVGDGTSYMSVHPPAWAVGIWIADNLMHDAASRRVDLATRVRYEDLIAGHGPQLRRLLAELDLLPGGDQPGTTPFDLDVLAEPPGVHALSGNPMRFRQATLTVRADDEWRQAMPRRRRVLISAATWPLLWHYGYAGAAGKHPGR
jgi:hypothetical protein